MDIDILDEEDNPMLHRTDVTFRIQHEEATPSRLSVRDSLAAMMNKDADEVVIHELSTGFGMRETMGYAKVYESPGDARDVEQGYMLDRNKIRPDAGAGDDEDAGEEGEEAAEAADEEAAEAADEEAAEAADDESGEAEEAAGAAGDEGEDAGEAEAEEA